MWGLKRRTVERIRRLAALDHDVDRRADHAAHLRAQNGPLRLRRGADYGQSTRGHEAVRWALSTRGYYRQAHHVEDRCEVLALGLHAANLEQPVADLDLCVCIESTGSAAAYYFAAAPNGAAVRERPAGRCMAAISTISRQ